MSGGSAPSWSLSAPIETLFEKPVALLAFEPITSSTNELYVISPVPVGSNFAITCDAPEVFRAIVLEDSPCGHNPR